MNKLELIALQRLPLEVKIRKTLIRIREWYEYNQGSVYVSFSGGKDSTVLLHLVRSIYPNVVAVFSDTGLEYPEIKEFVNSIDNVITIRPSKSFKQVVNEYGYPVGSKKVSRAIRDLQNPTENNVNIRNLYLTGITSSGNECPSRKLSKKWYPLIEAPFKVSERCCEKLKKEPLYKYEKVSGNVPFVGTMACEGSMREKEYLKDGCNAFNHKRPQSRPLGFWTEQDILEYLKDKNVDYANIYGNIELDLNGNYITTGEKSTGCMFCMFGVQLEQEPNRFQRMKKTHEDIYDYCINNLDLGKVLDYIDVAY